MLKNKKIPISFQVKCPLSVAGQSLAVERPPYLLRTDNGMCLDKKHSYYSQVQMQLGTSKRIWCDFVVFTKCEFFVERIVFDENHWLNLKKACVAYFKDVIAPCMIEQVKNDDAEMVEVN